MIFLFYVFVLLLPLSVSSQDLSEEDTDLLEQGQLPGNATYFLAQLLPDEPQNVTLNETEFEELFQSSFEFPSVVFETLFGYASDERDPQYNVTLISEAPGTYSGVNEVGEAFEIQVNEIIMGSAELSAEIDNDEDVDEETSSWMENNGYVAFAVEAQLEGPAGSTENVVAFLAKTASMPNYILSVLEPADEDESTAVESRRRRQLQRDLDVDQAVDRAKGELVCSEGGKVKVNATCVDEAEATYLDAKAVAEAEHTTARNNAIAGFNAGRRRILLHKIRKIAIAVAKCAALSFIPIIGSSLSIRCVIREILKILFICALKKALIKAILRLLLLIALENFRRALEVALEVLWIAIQQLCVKCMATGGGEPHFATFHGDFFDYHGVCDIVMAHSSTFGSGLGLDLHIRTEEYEGSYSIISNAALKIGQDVLEMKNDGSHFLNGILNAELPEMLADRYEVLKTGGKESELFDANVNHGFTETELKESVLITVNLGDGDFIELQAWKGFLWVNVSGNHKQFHDSVGFMGTWTKKGKIARDGIEDLHDPNEFAEEWQVLDTEPKLFQYMRSPQHPEPCRPAPSAALGRRLGEESIAELACAEVSGHQKEFCIFDVMVTGDAAMAMAYQHN